MQPTIYEYDINYKNATKIINQTSDIIQILYTCSLPG